MRFCKSISMLCLAMAAITASAQDTSRLVTFQHPVASTKKVLEALGAKVGLTLKTVPQTADEPVFVDVKDLPVKTVLDELAKAVGAEWEGSGTTMTLVRGTTLLKAQEAKVIGFRSEQIRKAIEDYAKDLATRPTLTEAEIRTAVDREKAAREAMMRDFRERAAGGGAVPIRAPEPTPGPAQRTLARLLKDIDPTWIASLKRGTRTVMATRNTAMQRPMPGSTQAALEKFVTEYNTWVDTTGEMPTGGNPGASFAIRIGNEVPTSERRNTAKRINQVGKAHLIFSRQNGNTSVDLVLFDAEGKQIGFAFLNLVNDSAAAEITDPKFAETKFSADETTMKFAKAVTGSANSSRATFSPSGLSTVTIIATGVPIGTSLGAGGDETLEGELRQRVASVDQNDPLAWIYNPVFGWMATELKRSVIACVPDGSLLPIAQRITGTGLTLNSFFTTARNLGVEYSDSNGVLRIQPQFHSWARESRVNRMNLSKLLGTLTRTGMVGLDDFANYALASHASPVRPGLDDAIIGSLDREAQSEFRFQVLPNWRLMRLYATFNPQQRQRLGSNEPLPFQLLADNQMALVNDMAFNDLRGPAIQARNDGEEMAPMFIAVSGGGAAGTVLQERTEALPNGVTKAGAIRVNLQREAGVFAGTSKKPGWRFFSLPEYGGHLAMAGSSNLPAEIEQKVYDRFRTGRRERYGFDFAFAENVTFSSMLNDEIVDSGFVAGPFANLPAAVREEINRNVELAKEQSRRVRSGPPLPIPPPPLN